MARIRSVHPGLFTDEAFASCSPAAQVLLIGVWTECDDNGIFEWKPVTLKMRIMPAHNVDVAALLGELDFHNIVCRFEINGRWFGAVRNFTKYQRPKFPKSVHTITPEIRKYVGSSAAATEVDVVDETPIPPIEEKSPQREDVVGVKEGEEKKEKPLASLETRTPANPDFRSEFDKQFWPNYPHKVGKPTAYKAFCKQRKHYEIDAILFGLDRYVAEKPSDRLWLNPATFLNQERFNDEPGEVAQGPPRRERVVNGYAALALEMMEEDRDAADRENRVSGAHDAGPGPRDRNHRQPPRVLDAERSDESGGTYALPLGPGEASAARPNPHPRSKP